MYTETEFNDTKLRVEAKSLSVEMSSNSQQLPNKDQITNKKTLERMVKHYYQLFGLPQILMGLQALWSHFSLSSYSPKFTSSCSSNH